MEETLKLTIDSTGAQRGADAFVGAIKKIKDAVAATDRAAGSLDKLRQSVGPGFSQIAKSLVALNDLKINASTARNLDALAKSLKKMDGIDAANLSRIARSVTTIATASGQVNGRAGGGVERLATAIKSFQLPADHARILQFLKAVGAAGANLQNVRMPSMGGGRGGANNPFSLFNRGGGSGNGGGNNGNGVGGRNFLGNNNNLVRMKGDWRGLENAMSLTYQTGTVLRSLFQSLTLAAFANSVMTATSSLISFNAQMEAVAGQLPNVSSPSQFAAEQFQYVSVAANRMGIDLQTAMKEFPKLASSMLFSGRSANEAQMVFNSFGAAMRVMGLSADRQQLVMLALTQGFSKGRVSAEELRRQLGEQIPGAFELMQQAIRDFTGDAMFDLDKALREGRVGSDAYILLAERMQQIYGTALPKALMSSSSQFTILGNEITKAFQKIGSSGVDAALADSFRRIAQELQSPEMQGAIEKLAQGLVALATKFGDLAVWAVNNLDKIGAAIKYIFLGSFFVGAVQAVLNLAGAFATLNMAAGPWMLVIAGLTLGIGKYMEYVGKAESEQKAYSNQISISQDISNKMEIETRKLAAATDDQTDSIRKNIDALVDKATVEAKLAKSAYEAEKASYEGSRFKSVIPLPGFLDGAKYANAIKDLADPGAAMRVEDKRKAAEKADATAKAAAEARDNANIARMANSATGQAMRKEYLAKGFGSRDAVDPLIEPEGGLTPAQAARAAEKRRNTAEEAIKRTSPMGEFLVKKNDAEAAFASKEGGDMLKKYGLDGAKVLERYNEQLKIESGMLDATSKAILQKKFDLEQLKVAQEGGLVSSTEAAAKEREINEAFDRQMGLIDPLKDDLLALEEAKRKINAASKDAAETQRLEALATADLAEKYEVLSAAQQAAALNKRMEDRNTIAAKTGGDATSANRRDALAYAANVDPLLDQKAQIDQLNALAAAHKLTQSEVTNAVYSMKAAWLELNGEMNNAPFDIVRGKVLAFAADVKPLNETIGNIFGDTLVSAADQFSSSLTDVLTGTKSLRESLYDIANGALRSIISGLVQWAIKALIVKFIMKGKGGDGLMGGGGGGGGGIAGGSGKEIAANTAAQLAGIAAVTAAQLAAISTVTAAQVASGAAITAAMTPAAFQASLATSGTNAAAASAAVSSFAGVFSAISAGIGVANTVSSLSEVAVSGASLNPISSVAGLTNLTFATGGLVRGPGSGTSDSIPARLSNGEFVVNSAATKEYLPLLSAINSGADTPMGMGGGGAVVQNNVTINVTGGGDGEDTGAQISRTLIPQLEQMTRRVLANEMRPGGMLRRAS